MNTEKIKRAVWLACGLLVLAPALVSAKADAVAVTDTTALFIIDFDFLAADEPYRIPIGAAVGADTATQDLVSYAVDPEVRVTNAIVLSDMPVRGTFYEVPSDSRGSFTLLILATVPKDATNGAYTATLTGLPHYRGEERQPVPTERLERFGAPTVRFDQRVQGPTLRLTADPE